MRRGGGWVGQPTRRRRGDEAGRAGWAARCPERTLAPCANRAGRDTGLMAGARRGRPLRRRTGCPGEPLPRVVGEPPMGAVCAMQRAAAVWKFADAWDDRGRLLDCMRPRGGSVKRGCACVRPLPAPARRQRECTAAGRHCPVCRARAGPAPRARRQVCHASAPVIHRPSPAPTPHQPSPIATRPRSRRPAASRHARPHRRPAIARTLHARRPHHHAAPAAHAPINLLSSSPRLACADVAVPFLAADIWPTPPRPASPSAGHVPLRHGCTCPSRPCLRPAPRHTQTPLCECSPRRQHQAGTIARLRFGPRHFRASNVSKPRPGTQEIRGAR